MPFHHNRKRRRGAVSVEFALCLPLVVLIFFASWEFCRANMLRHSADAAAYEGARRAIVPGATADDARDVALNVLAIIGTKDAQVEIEPSVIDDDTKDITVKVTVPLQSNSFVQSVFLKNDIVTSFTLARERYEETSVP